MYFVYWGMNVFLKFFPSKKHQHSFTFLSACYSSINVLFSLLSLQTKPATFCANVSAGSFQIEWKRLVFYSIASLTYNTAIRTTVAGDVASSSFPWRLFQSCTLWDLTERVPRYLHYNKNEAKDRQQKTIVPIFLYSNCLNKFRYKWPTIWKLIQGHA